MVVKLAPQLLVPGTLHQVLGPDRRLQMSTPPDWECEDYQKWRNANEPGSGAQWEFVAVLSYVDTNFSSQYPSGNCVLEFELLFADRFAVNSDDISFVNLDLCFGSIRIGERDLADPLRQFE